LNRRISIAYEVLSAIIFLHQGNETFQGCFHCDIKSANIVLTSKLEAKLVDCGLAKLVTNFDTHVSSSGVKGTFAYACPQYTSGAVGYEARCDIFSFGVVLTELLTGRLQNYQTTDTRSFNIFDQYVMDTSRNLVDDIDSTLNSSLTFSLPKYVHDFSNLALECMPYFISGRPTGNVDMNRLESIKNACANKELHIEGNSGDKPDDLSTIRKQLNDIENKVNKVSF
jgi:serine/threonine protein kinase